METKTKLQRPQLGAEKNFYASNQLVTLADLDRFRDDLLKEMKWLLSQKHTAPEKSWLKSGEVRKLLQISPGTLQHLRDSGQLPFTKLGGIIYYERQAIKSILGSGD
jgi:hypothetical protein